MKKILIFYLLIVNLVSYSQDNRQIIDEFAIKGKELWKIPGMSLVVVENDSTFFKSTYGVKNYFTNEEVDDKTIFSMASTTKAFIGMGLGILVDRDSIGWNDKVVDHLPKFKLSDPYISNDARVKDLLTHNLGIGNEDRLWTTDSTSIEELLLNFSKSENLQVKSPFF